MVMTKETDNSTLIQQEPSANSKIKNTERKTGTFDFKSCNNESKGQAFKRLKLL